MDFYLGDRRRGKGDWENRRKIVRFTASGKQRSSLGCVAFSVFRDRPEKFRHLYRSEKKNRLKNVSTTWHILQSE